MRNKIAVFWKHKITSWKKRRQALPEVEESEEINPYLPQIRTIMEAVLKRKKIYYGEFAPILIAGEDPETCLEAAEQLGEDLNYLAIVTDTPAYFENYADNMYEEQGLIVEILSPKQEKIPQIASGEIYGNVILDFEKKTENPSKMEFGTKIYIPIFKKAWESAGNLDITVPIGYNTMTVKGSKTEEKQLGFDKFERAFYENK